MSEAVCAADDRCRVYETHAPGDEETLSVAGYCVDSNPTYGTLGQTCGGTGSDVAVCEAFCLGADAASGVLGVCTNVCETHADCPNATINGAEYSFRCQPYVYSFGLDSVADEDNIYVGLCAPNPVGSTGADCSADFVCAEPAEACTPIVVTFGPDYESKTDYVCIDKTAGGAVTPTKGLGETCDPNATSDECTTAYCLTDATGLSGVCSAPCDPDNDTCGDTAPGMVCVEDVLYPRSGAYADNTGTVWRCDIQP